jgi:AraC-like DNA-binding protein
LTIRRGKVGLGTSRIRGRRDDGPPVYTYEAVPGVPPVSAIRLGQESSPGGLPPGAHPHSHDFLVLTFHLERDGGSLRLGDREWQIEAGDVYLIAPGEIVDPSGLEEAEGFGFIEDRYSEGVSLRDVARAVSLSRGHLTTVVRRKTGRTVQEWIAERRLAEARRLLVETDLSVEEVGQRVGYGDPGYFVRSFRRAHGATPLGWRRAGRP